MGFFSDVFKAVDKWATTPSNINVLRNTCPECNGTGKCPACSEKSVKFRKRYRILLKSYGIVSLLAPMLIVLLINYKIISSFSLPSDTSLIPVYLMASWVFTVTIYYFMAKIHCPLCQVSAGDIENLGKCVKCDGRGYFERTVVTGGISLKDAYKIAKQEPRSKSVDNINKDYRRDINIASTGKERLRMDAASIIGNMISPRSYVQIANDIKIVMQGESRVTPFGNKNVLATVALVAMVGVQLLRDGATEEYFNIKAQVCGFMLGNISWPDFVDFAWVLKKKLDISNSDWVVLITKLENIADDVIENLDSLMFDFNLNKSFLAKQ